MDDVIRAVNIRWAVGIAVALLVALSSILWSAHSEAATRVAEIRVLEARANANENAIAGIAGSVAQLTEQVSAMRASQAIFQTKLENQIVRMRDFCVSDLGCSPRAAGSAALGE